MLFGSIAYEHDMLAHEPLGGGGIKLPPLWFFCNSSTTRRDSDAKFCIAASNEYLAHMCTKFQTYNWSGDVTVTSQTFVTNFRKSKFRAMPKTQF